MKSTFGRLCVRSIGALATVVILFGSTAFADPSDESGGADFVKPVSCTDTTIASITDRFGNKLGTRSSAGVTTGINVSFANGEGVVSYDINRVAALEAVGGRVQVCFLGKVLHADTCVPSVDKRGFMYRVYDYRLHAAYTMMNSQHVCGGA